MNYFTIAEAAEASFIEKRSEFIGYIAPVKTNDEAVAFINSIRAKHRKAKHNVYAYILRNDNISRYSDDGEPQGTGGVPVLGVLQKSNLTDVGCVVTRYFGGVLLGASGLTRAYSAAAALVVQNAQIQHFCEAEHLRLQMDYGMYGKVSYILPEFEVLERGSDFGENVTLDFDVKCELFESLSARLNDLFNGAPQLERIETHFADFGSIV